MQMCRKGSRGLVDGKLNMSQQYALEAKRANCILGGIRYSIDNWSKGLFNYIQHWYSLISSTFWAPECKKDIKILECVQRRTTRMVKGLEGMIYEERLRILSMFSLEKRRLRGHFIAVYNFLMRRSREGGADLFSLVSGDRRQVNGLQLHHWKFRLDSRKKFFIESVVKHWNKLPRKVVMVPSSSLFEKHLGNALSHMVLAHLNKLVKHKFMGPDGMHPQLLSKLLNVITRALLIILERSWQLGEVPKGWKKANITPFFKKGRNTRRKIQGMIGKSASLCSLGRHMEGHEGDGDLSVQIYEGQVTLNQPDGSYDEVTGSVCEGRGMDVLYFSFSKAEHT
ncbi:LOW QUALITY PROTEIN: hypothetical protein QYF61_000847 [Mycteria americana]|uniref:Uncharacterized protein n=1 Tax=Mycteria americana TaxID=33587 RepID=A0AAN7PD01_MYCAM|nr:LOW QUALITY PROTEIN: hypothetical protein QYF61_000847 [Mycteria americana]